MVRLLEPYEVGYISCTPKRTPIIYFGGKSGVSVHTTRAFAVWAFLAPASLSQALP